MHGSSASIFRQLYPIDVWEPALAPLSPEWDPQQKVSIATPSVFLRYRAIIPPESLMPSHSYTARGDVTCYCLYSGSATFNSSLSTYDSGWLATMAVGLVD